MLILEYESCGYGELFLKSKEGLHLFGGFWHTEFGRNKEMSCAGECKRQPQCKSAMFDVDENKCNLRT